MEFIPVEIGLIPIILAVLLGPLLVKKIERNLEAFLFLMGACAVALSRSWHIDLVEEAIQEPVVIGIMLSILATGLIINYLKPHFLQEVNGIISDGITMKVIFLEIVIVLGLSAAIITPILPFFVLVEAVNHLPILRRTKANVTALGCLSILLGAVLGLIEGPSSPIAAMKMQGALPSAGFLPLELQSMYVMLGIFVLGLTSLFFAEEKAISIKMQTPERVASHKKAAIWGIRVCLFAGALLLVGVAYGVDI
jgi:predicted cation transporter